MTKINQQWDWVHNFDAFKYICSESPQSDNNYVAGCITLCNIAKTWQIHAEQIWFMCVLVLWGGVSHIVAMNKSKRRKAWLHFIRLDANSARCNMQKGSAAKNSKTANLMRRFNVNRINIRAESCSVFHWKKRPQSTYSKYSVRSNVTKLSERAGLSGEFLSLLLQINQEPWDAPPYFILFFRKNVAESNLSFKYFTDCLNFLIFTLH